MDYALPHPLGRPDEERIVGRALTILATSNFHPVTFDYPSLPMYLNAGALAVYAKSRFHDREDFLLEAAVRAPGLAFEVCRFLSVLLGVATVWAGAKLASTAYPERGIGLVTALLLATNYLLVRDARFATVDVATVFFVTLSLVFAVKAARDQTPSRYVAAGVFAGLATSSKYNAGLVVLGTVAAAWCGFREHRGKWGRNLALFGLALTVAFALTSPYALVSTRAVALGLRHHREFLYDRAGDRALFTHLSFTLPVGLGWPVYVAACLGFLRALRLRRPADLVLLAFFIPFFGVIGSVRMIFPRYVLPLVPILIVWAVDVSLSVLPRRRLALTALALAFSVPALYASIAFDRLAARKDTRVLASAWVRENVPRRTAIAVCRGYGAPDLNTDRRRPPAFDVRPIDCDVTAVRREAARFVVTHEHAALSAYSSVPETLRTWLREKARPLAVFRPFGEDPRVAPRFYPNDAFYLPFTGFRGVERGGPLITIWDLGETAAGGGRSGDLTRASLSRSMSADLDESAPRAY